MVTDDNKYWFEKDAEENAESSSETKNETENGKNTFEGYDRSEDLFGFGGTDDNKFENKFGNTFGDGAFSGQENFNGANGQGSDYGAPASSAEDPHEKHYKSDYAEGVSKNFENASSSMPTAGKAVRKTMLKKLLKYDYKALFKFLVPCYIILVALAALVAICVPIAEHISWNNDVASNAFYSIFTSVMVMYVIGVASCSVICIVAIATRYQKNLFSAEGYLTLSIPATAEEHIFSKLISGFSTVLLTAVVAIVSIFIAFIPYMDRLISFLSGIFEQLSYIFAASPGHATLLTIELTLLAVIGSAFNLQVFYSCICLGQLFVNKNRTSSAAIAFVIYIAASQVIGTFSSASGIFGIFINSMGGLHALLWIFILLEAGATVGLFFWQRYVLRNKVNLA